MRLNRCQAEILKFELEEKIGHHSKVKVHGESNGVSLNALKQCLNPERGHQGQTGAKNQKISEYELGDKLDHHFQVKFRGKSNGDSLDALKRCLDPEMDHKSLIVAKN